MYQILMDSDIDALGSLDISAMKFATMLGREDAGS
ncbi:hypothetical protein C8N29_11428 [Agitococcus lubricus]|uniref:Uncharacterized protein n=1 Tax=Agitococcus lubricus TaxID=1077255 RepID=A0A2T5IW77_9GAMM|nr:hypothetical protein C8N29_11428 [Agitococcus lubricus]